MRARDSETLLYTLHLHVESLHSDYVPKLAASAVQSRNLAGTCTLCAKQRHQATCDEKHKRAIFLLVIMYGRGSLIAKLGRERRFYVIISDAINQRTLLNYMIRLVTPSSATQGKVGYTFTSQRRIPTHPFATTLITKRELLLAKGVLVPGESLSYPLPRVSSCSALHFETCLNRRG